MSRIIFYAAVLCVFSAVYAPVLATQAQDELDEIHVSQSLELAVNYPSGWSAEEFNTLGRQGFRLSSDGAVGEMPSPDATWLTFKDLQNFDQETTPDARLGAALDANEFVPGRNVVDLKGVELQIGERTLFYLEFHEVDSEVASGLWLAMPYNQDRYLLATLSTGSPETYQAIRDTALAIVASARSVTNEELLAVSQREVIDDFVPEADIVSTVDNAIFGVPVPPDTTQLKTYEIDSMPTANLSAPESEFWFRQRNEMGGETYFQVRSATYTGLTVRASLIDPYDYYYSPEYRYAMLNGRPAVILTDSELVDYAVVGVRLQGGEIGVIRALRQDGTSISDADMRTAYTFAAYLEIHDGYNYAGLQPMAEQGVQSAPIIDNLNITTVTADSVQVVVRYHDTDGDADVAFFNVTESFGGAFASQSDNLFGLSDTGTSGTSTIIYNCSPGGDTASIVEIYLQDDLRNVGESRFIRVSCINGEADVVELSAEEAQVPLSEQLGAPADITTNTAPEILDATFDVPMAQPVIQVGIIYKDLEGDANTIRFVTVQTDGGLFPSDVKDLESTYAAQSAGTAKYEQYFNCFQPFVGILEVVVTDAQNNSSEPFYIQLNCGTEDAGGSIVTEDAVPTVELAPGAPIISEITFESSYYGDVQALDMTITYGDAEGDANKAVFTVIEGDTITFRDMTQTLAANPELQVLASEKYTINWQCSKQAAFSNTIQMILMDAQGNESAPVIFRVDCELVGGDTPAGTLISMGDGVEIADQPTPTDNQESQGGTTPSVRATATVTSQAPTPTPTPIRPTPVNPNCPTLPQRLVNGEIGQSIIDGEGATNIRPNPGVGQPIGQIKEGESFLVISESQCGIARNGDRLRYFMVQTNSGLQGWVPEANDDRYFMEPG